MASAQVRALKAQVDKLAAEVAELRERVEQYDQPRQYPRLVEQEGAGDGCASVSQLRPR